MSVSASGPAEASPGQDQQPVTTEHKYYLWVFAVSIATSTLLILFSYHDFSKAMPGGTLIGDVENFIGRVGSGAHCLLDDIRYQLSAGSKCIPPLAEHEAGASHSAVTLSAGIAQIIGVIAIAALWFFAFVFHTSESHSRKYIWLSLVATAAYVFGMFNAYQPAVLVAALVAIFVAAEHFGTLEKQGGELATHGGNLKRVVDDLGRIRNSTQLSLSKEGRRVFMKDVYGAYSRAETIYAVVRDHSIEDDWWWHAEGEFVARKGMAEVWNWYESVPAAEKALTLYSALTQPDGIGGVAQGGQGVNAAYFVSYMPMPESDEWRKRDRAELFDDLLGLAWECLVLDRVRKTLDRKKPMNQNGSLNRNESIGEWISNPLCWVHATNLEVWQVTKRDTLENSSVLKTADLREGVDNPLDKVLSSKLIEATQAEIRRYLQRGMAAEEYLCAILCYALIKKGAGAALRASDGYTYDTIVLCLGQLNMAEWLDRREREPSPARGLAEARIIRERICVGIFGEFMEMCRSRPVNDADPNERPTSSFFLAQEVL